MKPLTVENRGIIIHSKAALRQVGATVEPISTTVGEKRQITQSILLAALMVTDPCGFLGRHGFTWRDVSELLDSLQVPR